MSKTWQEKFDKKFLQQSYCGNPECEYKGNDKCFHGTENAIKKFISDLRKHDEEELIKMLSSEYYYDVNTTKLTQLIKHHYENN